jgi:hypothetical protein
MSVIIKRCICKHEFQDKQYGKDMRVHNTCEKGGRVVGSRCTVCGTKKES